MATRRTIAKTRTQHVFRRLLPIDFLRVQFMCLTTVSFRKKKKKKKKGSARRCQLNTFILVYLALLQVLRPLTSKKCPTRVKIDPPAPLPPPPPPRKKKFLPKSSVFQSLNLIYLSTSGGANHVKIVVRVRSSAICPLVYLSCHYCCPTAFS